MIVLVVAVQNTFPKSSTLRRIFRSSCVFVSYLLSELHIPLHWLRRGLHYPAAGQGHLYAPYWEEDTWVIGACLRLFLLLALSL